MSDATKYRKQAEECWEFAQTARNPDDRKFWLKLGKDWLELAEATDKYSKNRAHKSSEAVLAS